MNNGCLLLLACLFVRIVTAQVDVENDSLPELAAKDSIVVSAWTVGLGYNFVDDSGDVTDKLFSVNAQWNALPYPSRISIGRYFKSGIGLSAVGSYNKYKVGKQIDGRVNQQETDYLALDTGVSYNLNKIVGETAWFDPYLGLGFGFTRANTISRVTFNTTVGFRIWFSDRWGADLNTMAKWTIGETDATNHVQYGAGAVYRFGIEKALSKKGEEKLALRNALEKQRQQYQDSLAQATREKAALALAEELENAKKEAALAAERAISEREQREARLRAEIDKIGHAYFPLNSSYLNPESKRVLDELTLFLRQNPTVVLRVASHTDSRGSTRYNQWLSDRRVLRTTDYLIANGVPDAQLVSEALGETRLLNECDDVTYCPEEKHSVNRRSEFGIVAF